MSEKLKTKLEIIEETIAFYTEDISRRSVDEFGNCQYVSENGNVCAFSRCCIDPASLKPYEGYVSNRILSKLGFDCLKPEYRIEDVWFWNRLQNFHDSSKNWNENGLTEKGLECAHDLKIYLNS